MSDVGAEQVPLKVEPGQALPLPGSSRDCVEAENACPAMLAVFFTWCTIIRTLLVS